jgi:uncharacterized protein YoxC
MDRKEIEHLVYIALLIIAIALLIVNVFEYTNCSLKLVDYIKKNNCVCYGTNTNITGLLPSDAYKSSQAWNQSIPQTS